MPEDEDIGLLSPIIITLIVIGLWILSGIILYHYEERGSFGDSFGAINALFSGLAFAGVIFAILLQRKELQLQRKELALTRDELAGQRGEMELQNKTLLKQSFENTFFQLLSLQQEIVNSIDLVDSQKNNYTTSGRDCFSVFYSRFVKIWTKNHSELQGEDELERICKTYEYFYSRHQQEFGHYFRSLYHIFKLIENSDIVDKRLYTNLVRAQLSSYELALLFYNCLTSLGNKKFYPLVTKYSILKNLSKDQLISRDHLHYYDVKAFE